MSAPSDPWARRAALAAALDAPEQSAEVVAIQNLEAMNSSLRFDLAALLGYEAAISNPISDIYVCVWDPIFRGALSNGQARAATAVARCRQRIDENNKKINKLKKIVAGRPGDLAFLDRRIIETLSVITQSEELITRLRNQR